MSENVPNGIIKFEGFRVTDFGYECDASFEFPTEQEKSYSMRIQKDTVIISEQLIEVKLRVTVFWSNDGEYESAPYKVSLELLGRFSSNVQIDMKWETNALAILFPYARSIITSFTSQTGREPVILPTVNLAALLRNEGKKKESE